MQVLPYDILYTILKRQNLRTAFKFDSVFEAYDISPYTVFENNLCKLCRYANVPFSQLNQVMIDNHAVISGGVFSYFAGDLSFDDFASNSDVDIFCPLEKGDNLVKFLQSCGGTLNKNTPFPPLELVQKAIEDGLFWATESDDQARALELPDDEGDDIARNVGYPHKFFVREIKLNGIKFQVIGAVGNVELCKKPPDEVRDVIMVKKFIHNEFDFDIVKNTYDGNSVEVMRSFLNKHEKLDPFTQFDERNILRLCKYIDRGFTFEFDLERSRKYTSDDYFGDNQLLRNVLHRFFSTDTPAKKRRYEPKLDDHVKEAIKEIIKMYSNNRQVLREAEYLHNSHDVANLVYRTTKPTWDYSIHTTIDLIKSKKNNLVKKVKNGLEPKEKYKNLLAITEGLLVEATCKKTRV